MNSWARLACYPRGSFYPLSHGPSTRNRRITLPDFRPCSTCRSRSQATLCQCTLKLISIQLGVPFGRLLSLPGGDRPSQPTHQTLFFYKNLGSKPKQSGISRLTPPKLASRLQSLPPILHNLNHEPMSSCSKAPRGLFVLPRVTRIFTGPAISPSLLLRQCSSRYAFRAGRNLPDKGLRYLRTVIVTAAVHRGFSSERELLPLTFRHWAGVSLYTSAFALAQTCVFGKQSLEPLCCGPQCVQTYSPRRQGLPFSLSYGVNLPSSLTIVLSFTWGLLPLPTCVGLRYGRRVSSMTRVFLAA